MRDTEMEEININHAGSMVTEIIKKGNSGNHAGSMVTEIVKEKEYR